MCSFPLWDERPRKEPYGFAAAYSEVFEKTRGVET